MRKLISALFFSIPFATSALGQSGPEAQQSIEIPKVVLVGDSIRLSYASTVTEQLQGKANVVSATVNGGDSTNIVAHLEEWVIREKPSVVHFNCGIHDTKKHFTTGKFQVSPEEYEANLRKIVESIRDHTDAVVIFATTTPILDDRAAAARKGRNYELLQSSVNQYNAIAKRVMTELEVPVNDLHAILTNPSNPHTADTLIGSDGVHLTNAGKELAGKQVAFFVSKYIDKQ